MREVARRGGRDFKAVHADLDTIVKSGVIDRADDGVVFPFDRIHFEFEIESAREQGLPLSSLPPSSSAASRTHLGQQQILISIVHHIVGRSRADHEIGRRPDPTGFPADDPRRHPP